MVVVDLTVLNEQQKQAVTHDGGPAMVLAGAGSGKTKVLTTRVAWLMEEKNVHEDQILLVTFTNKAAAEMNQRVVELTGNRLQFSGTFHSLGAKILRKHGYLIGLDPNFTIFDSDDQLSLLKKIYKQKGYSTKQIHPRAAKGTISQAKNELIDPDEYQQFATGSYQTTVGKIYQHYEKALRDNQAVDFDDLLLLTVRLFQNYPKILHQYQDQIHHVLVDEYQDTNKVQYQLSKYLSAPQNNLYVVGDFAQSIYAWRGADYRNMLQLKQDFPTIKEYRLEQNYRSTQTILDAATGVISQTDEHPVLSLWTEQKSSGAVTIIETKSDNDEASVVVNALRNELTSYSYRDVVILYRTNAQSRAFEEACLRVGIPYKLVGGFKFYERKEIKDVLSYLRLVVNPQDTISRARAEKLGKRRLAQFEKWLEKEKNEQSTTNENMDQENTGASDEQPNEPGLNQELLPNEQAEKSPFVLIKTILEKTAYRDLFDSSDPDDVTRLENIEELLNVAAQFHSAATFLENIALVQDNEFHDVANQINGESENVLTLMSLHSAKGLEFPVVFMVGMEDGLLPHSRSILEKSKLEEERRLCYVGITRAKEKLYITYAKQRWQYGSRTSSIQSRFLQDIPQTIIDFRSTAFTSYDNDNYSNSRTNQSSNYFYKRNQKTAPKKSFSEPKRKLVLDDDELNAVLTGDVDLDAFLDS